MASETRELHVPTSYEKIKMYSDNLKNYIREKKEIPFGLKKFPYEIKMDIDTKGLGRIKSELGCKRILCVLGLGEGKDGEMEFKVSFLGLDEKDEVDPRHKPNPNKRTDLVDGEETWPPEDTITDADNPLP
jgi:hypothetical protein